MWEFTTNETSAYDTFDYFCYPFNDTDVRYWNVSSWDYCDCNATFAADPDIAGIGIMISFAGMSLLTLAIALVAAYYDTTIRQRARLLSLLQLPIIKEDSQQGLATGTEIEMTEHPRPWEETIDIDSEGVAQTVEQKQKLALVQTLLGNLCDLQLFTGVAVITAAFAQGDSLTFYHRSLITEYWWLALNSFFAARQDELYGGGARAGQKTKALDPIKTTSLGKAKAILLRIDEFFCGEECFRTWLRRLLIFGCVTEFLVFDAISLQTLHPKWDALSSGKCFISHDKTPEKVEYLWLSGLILFDFTLVISLIDRTKHILSATSIFLHKREDALFKACFRLWKKFFVAMRGRESMQAIKFFLLGSGLSSATICYTVFLQFAAIWAFGSGFYVVEVAFYIGFWAWNFYDIVDLKISNAYLITGSEVSWGFGQVYAVAAMGIFIFNIVDAVNSIKKE